MTAAAASLPARLPVLRFRSVVRRAPALAVALAVLPPAVLAQAGPPPTRRARERPSGQAMPSRNPRGWRRVFSDDFSGRALNSRHWGTYAGQPGGDPGGWWDPSHVVVRNGMAVLRSYRDLAHGGRWVSGGMSSARALKQGYGKYLVRFRVDAGRGIAAVLLLWPSTGPWPPEIDFAENGGENGRRDQMTATLHYGAGNSTIQRTVTADFTRWHTIGVEWSPGRLVYTLDGRAWATVRSSGVPSGPMELDAQTQAGTPGDRWAPAPDATTPHEVDMDLDWVVAYARAR